MKHEYGACVEWELGNDDFLSNKYSRVHQWSFDGGITVPASASPQVIRPPLTSEEAVDPEEALVASVASCHMLFFLALAGKKKLEIRSYRDEAIGILERGEDGKTSMTQVILKPRIEFGGETKPAAEMLEELHEAAHEHCFIANSLKAKISIELPE